MHLPMLVLIKPILFAFIKSDSVKRLVVELLEKLAQSTDNNIDDQAVAIIRDNIFKLQSK